MTHDAATTSKRPTRPDWQWRALLTLLLSVLMVGLAGCAGARYISTPSNPPPSLELKASDANVEIALHYIIVPDGPGSWTKEAAWTEWRVTIKNASPFDVPISEMSLIDPRGVYVGSQYATISALESETVILGKAYKDWFVGSAGATAIATVGSSAAAQAAISTGSMIPIYGLSYLATLPSILFPYLEAKDREAVEAEFHRRQLPSPLKLSAGASVTGSVFFPIVPRPNALVIGYRRSENEKPSQIKLPLSQLWTPPPAK